jgi:hypothetical protein
MKLFIIIAGMGVTMAFIAIAFCFAGGRQAGHEMLRLSSITQSNDDTDGQLDNLNQILHQKDIASRFARAIGWWLAGLFIWLVFLTAGYFLGESKDQVEGCLLSVALLGPLGLIIALCLPNKRQHDIATHQAYLLQQQLYYQRRASNPKDPDFP